MIHANNESSGLFDCTGVEIVVGDEITIDQDGSDGTRYWVDRLPSNDTWFFFKQYGTMDELSLVGNLRHCIDNLGMMFKIVGHYVPTQSSLTSLPNPDTVVSS